VITQREREQWLLLVHISHRRRIGAAMAVQYQDWSILDQNGGGSSSSSP